MSKYLIFIYLFFPVSSSATDGLGRLFLTPEQRAQLDLVRVKRDQHQTTNSDASMPAMAAPAGPGVVTYNGMVKRSDGKSTVWINGKPVNERDRTRKDAEVNVLGLRNDGAVSLAIPQANRIASLKVGQNLEVTSGRIDEAYLRRAAPTTENPVPTLRAPSTPQATPRASLEHARKE